MRNRIGILTCVLWALLPAGQGRAYSSLSVGLGNSGVLKVPHTVPFTALGDYRVEFRIHDWTPPAGLYSAAISWGSVYMSVRYLEIILKPSGEICASNWVDTAMPRGGTSCANLSGHTDVVIRVQRFGNSYGSEAGASGSFLLEARDASGSVIPSYCGSNGTGSTYACPIDTPTVKDWSGMAGYVGNPGDPTAFSLAWLKWSSTTKPPGSAFSQETTPADLADWRFENNLNDEGTGGYGVSIGSFHTTPAYRASPGYFPFCDAGGQQVFRAGDTATFDGTGSYPLDGGTALTYMWQELSGPTMVAWSGQNTANPTVSQASFGSYTFQLTVTDSGGHSKACTVNHGFAATDDHDVVTTGNTAVDTLLGPMIRYGKNPWPWFDDRHKADSDRLANLMDTYWPAFWDVAGPGTVTVAAGSTAVTGSGTTFTTTFCQGPENPTTPKGGTPEVIVWYPNDSPGGHGARFMPVASCQSDTQLTLAAQWASDVADCHDGGCQYAYGDSGLDSVWANNSSPANFYDAVAAFYALYYRTGLDTYRTAARTLADRFWIHELDSGNVCNLGGGGVNGMGGCIYNQRWAPRNLSTLGMVLRALDGRPDMWPGIRNIAEFFRTYYLVTGCPTCYGNDLNWGLWDIREEAYHMATVAYLGMFDPDTTLRPKWKAALSYAMDHLWNVTQAADKSWKQVYTMNQQNSWSTNTSVSLTHGSREVTGNGTAWTYDMISKAIMGGTGRRMLFFDNPAATPANMQAQEATYYVPTYVDATHLTLDRPYEGATGTHGWMLDYGAVGWATQPFIEGILGTAFGFTAEALADTDPTNAALARNHVVDIATWERNYGFRSAAGGMYYFAGSVDCMAPIPESSGWCTADDPPAQARVLNAESLRSVMLGYQYTGDATLKAFGDTLYNAMFAKPSTCPDGSSVCVPDGQYVSDLNDGIGWFMSGTPTNNGWHKYFGMFFGIGAGSAWPAYRTGGPRGPRRRVVRVGFNMGVVGGASQVRVTTTAPTGEREETNCTSAPCAVSIDSEQGNHVVRLEYLSGSGKVLAVTETPVATRR